MKLQGFNSGRYEIISALGSGGMGEVYRARDQVLGRDVAIKILPDEISNDRESLSRLEVEAKALGSLSHPNILTIYDFVTEDGRSFVVMELLKGETLESLLRREKISIQKSIEIGIAIINGLAAAHRAGVIHRDLKPANFILLETGGVKILDFGVARLITHASAETRDAATESRLTVPGVVLGTAAYMSPEQARGQNLDERTDLFSVGIVLYEMVTGLLPFPGNSTGEILESLFSKPPASPIQLNPSVPTDLQRILYKALEKDPNQRYQSAAEMRTDLEHWQQECLPVPHQIVSSTRRKMGVWIGVVAILVILIAAIISYSRQTTDGLLFARSKVPSKGVTAIAVLPFTNLSQDKDQEYFSDGLTEELLTLLARNPNLRVTSRSSAFLFKGKEADIKTIADKLKVRYVLKGSVQKSGNHLRISAQLIDVATDSGVWSQSYDRQMENLFAVQDDIATSVLDSLNVTLEEDHTHKEQKVNLKALNAFLLGNYFFNKQDHEKAIAYYGEALQIDPNYAPAWAGLSMTRIEQVGFGEVPQEEAYAKARIEAEKALVLDPNSAQAYVTLGYINWTYDWDWSGANAAFSRALRIDPASADAVAGEAAVASILGHFDQAIELDRRSIELDPLEVSSYVDMGYHLYSARRWIDAESAYRKVLELNPNYPVHGRLGMIYLLQSKTGQSLAEIQLERRAYNHEFALMLFHYAAENKKDLAALAKFIEMHQEDSAFQIAEIYGYWGEPDKAFEWLDRAYNQHDGGCTAIKGDPLLRSLKRDPRWPEFLKKMKLSVD